jgi:hypothetical protein
VYAVTLLLLLMLMLMLLLLLLLFLLRMLLYRYYCCYVVCSFRGGGFIQPFTFHKAAMLASTRGIACGSL